MSTIPTNATAATSTTTADRHPQSHDRNNNNIGMIIRNELEQIRRAITCPICLCTMKDPICLAGCSHTFCASCIQQSLAVVATHKGPHRCPLCHVAWTRRSIQHNGAPDLCRLIQHYKRLTQCLGVAPMHYTPSIPTCTQMEVTVDMNEYSDGDSDDDVESANSCCDEESDGDKSKDPYDDDDVDDSGPSEPRRLTLTDMADQYHVSQYMYHALQQQPDAPSSMLLQEQAQIVQANQSYYHQQKARHRTKQNRRRTPRTKTSTIRFVPSKIVTAATRNETAPTVSVASIPSRSPPNRHTTTPESLPTPTRAVTTIPPPARGTTTPSWTQIVQEAQSQQVANMSDDDDDEDDHFYSARDQSQKSASQRHHDRTRLLVTMPQVHHDDDDDDDDDDVHLDSEPIGGPSNDDGQLEDDDDDDSLPPASNIPPRRRSSLVVAKILQEQSDSTAESVSSSSSNRENDDNDVTNGDLKPKAISTRIPPKPDLDSNHVSVVVPSRPIVAEGDGVGAARLRPDTDPDMSTTFRLGEIVQVQPRTGPGQNQPGGIAEITKVHLDHDVITYDVHYVLNRRQRERNLEACYISVAPGYNDTSTVDTTTTIHTTHAAQQRYGPRRSCPTPVSVLPSPLRAALRADGCDVDGIATRKALSQYNNQQHRLTSNHTSDKENSHIQNKEAPRGTGTIQTNKRKVMVTNTVTTNSSPTKSRQAPSTKRLKGADVAHSWDCSLEKAWTNAMKCQMADERYRNQIETALQKGVIYLCTSLLSIIEQEQLQHLCRLVHKQVKVKITEAIEPKRTTICLLPSSTSVASTTTKCADIVADRRSIKAMYACLDGIPIVSTSWIGHCLQRKRVTVPSKNMFVRTLPTKTLIGSISEFGVAHQAARVGHVLHHSLTSYQPLYPVKIAYMVGFDNTSSDTSNFCSLLRRAGANEVVLSPSVALLRLRAFAASKCNSKIEYFVIVCNDGKASNNTMSPIPDALFREINHFDTHGPTPSNVNSRLMVVNLQWLFDSVTCGVLLQPDETSKTKESTSVELDRQEPVHCYRPNEARARELWQATCSSLQLKNNLEP